MYYHDIIHTKLRAVDIIKLIVDCYNHYHCQIVRVYNHSVCTPVHLSSSPSNRWPSVYITHTNRWMLWECLYLSMREAVFYSTHNLSGSCFYRDNVFEIVIRWGIKLRINIVRCGVGYWVIGGDRISLKWFKYRTGLDRIQRLLNWIRIIG
jgi:hypothetical protein